MNHKNLRVFRLIRAALTLSWVFLFTSCSSQDIEKAPDTGVPPTLPTLPSDERETRADTPSPLGPPPDDIGLGFTKISNSLDQPVNLVVATGDVESNMLPERSVANFGDLDGDGFPEVIFANMNWEPNTRASQVFKYNRESQSLSFSNELTDNISELTGFATAVIDVDGDGMEDVLASGSPKSILYGTGNGKYKNSYSYPLPPGVSTEVRPQGAIHLADVDQDGWLDILLGEGQCEGEAPTLNLLLRTHNRQYENRSELLSPAMPNGSPYVAYAGPFGHAQMALFAGGGACDNTNPNEPIFVQNGLNEAGYPLFEAMDVTPEDSLYKDTPEVSFGPLTLGRPMGTVNADLDGDGTLDFLVTLSRHYAMFKGGEVWPFFDATKYNTIVARTTETGRRMIPWGALPMDLDHDGRLDLIITHGSGDALTFVEGPQAMGPQHTGVYWNAGNFIFTEITEITGLMEWGNWRALLQGDLNKDGLPDLSVGGVGQLPSIFLNETNGDGRSIGIKLRGTTSNHLGMGAKMHLEYEDGNLGPVQVMGGVASPLGVSEPIVFMSIPKDSEAALVINWPSGLLQKVALEDTSGVLEIEEPSTISVSPESRRCAADQSCSFEITVTPRDTKGEIAEADEISIELTNGMGTWTTSTLQREDGAWKRTLEGQPNGDSSVIEVTIDGTPLQVRPRVWWSK